MKAGLMNNHQKFKKKENGEFERYKPKKYFNSLDFSYFNNFSDLMVKFDRNTFYEYAYNIKIEDFRQTLKRKLLDVPK